MTKQNFGNQIKFLRKNLNIELFNIVFKSFEEFRNIIIQYIKKYNKYKFHFSLRYPILIESKIKSFS